MTKRVVANLAVFLVLTAVLVSYGIVSLLGNPFAHRQTAYVIFPTASGIRHNFTVALNGVDIGSVATVTPVASGAKVVLSFSPGVRVPADVTARVDLANALGEQQVDLVPSSGAPSPALRPGARVPLGKNGAPTNVGNLIKVASRLLAAVPAGSLNTVLRQSAIALAGRSADMHQIINASVAFDKEFLAYQAQFKALLANAPPILNTVAGQGAQLRQSLANTEVLTQILAKRRYDLVDLMNQGAQLSQVAGSLVLSQRSNIACLLHDTSQLAANVAQPANLANLNTSLQINEMFFGPMDWASPFGPAKSLYASDPNHPSQVWRRMRLYLPPKNPPASQYNPTGTLPPTKPGAGCITEYGQGVLPAAQANASPPGPGGRLVPAPASESYVAGSGDAPGAAEGQGAGGAAGAGGAGGAQDTAYNVPVSSGSLTFLAAGLAGFALVLGRRGRAHRRAA
ncbi:MAG: MCE family protein [Acidimicrobiales bacterium]